MSSMASLKLEDCLHYLLTNKRRQQFPCNFMNNTKMNICTTIHITKGTYACIICG
jgi:hypothetical protein